MAENNREASSLVHSSAAFKDRAAKAGLSREEIDAVVESGITSMAQMAFAVSPPGTAPSEAEIRAFFQGRTPVTMGTITSTKLLIFQCHTLVVADIKSEVTKKDDSTSHSSLPSAERDRRIEQQKKKLCGLRFKGDEEVAHSCYDLVFTLLEKDTLVYLPPDRFVTRRFELLQKKPPKQLTLDNDSLTIKEKPSDFVCSTRTELELLQALRRRALAFDLVGLVPYDVMNSYHSELMSHLQDDAPPGYNNTSVTQVLRADRAAFLYMAETITSLKRNAAGDMPLAVALPTVLTRPTVTFHLLPLAAGNAAPKATPKPAPLKRKHEEVAPKPSGNTKGAPKIKGKGKGKTKKRGRGPNVPKELINKSLETPEGRRICWPFNMASGCKDAAPGQSCSRGLHVCAEPGCHKPHGLQQHS